MSPAIAAVLDRVVGQAAELLHVSKVGLAVLEPDATGPGVLRFVASRGLSAKFSERVRPTHWRDGTTAMAIQRRQPVWTADVLNDPTIDLAPATRAGVEAEGYRAVLSVPLLTADRVLGALVLYRDDVAPFAREAIELAQVFAAQAAVAIDNAQLYREAADRASRLHTLSALTRLIVSASTSGAVFQAVAEAAAELLGAELARVWVDDPDRGMVRVEGHAGVARPMPPTTEIGHGIGIVGAVIASRELRHGPDILEDQALIDRPQNEQLGLGAYAALPLLGGGHVLGVLLVAFAERRAVTADELEMLRLLADHAGIAIRLSHLYREASRRRREAEVIAALTSRLNESLELQDILEHLTVGARDLCGADTARIAVRTPEDPTVRFRHWVGARYPGWDAVIVEPGKGVGGRVLTTGMPFRTDEYLSDARITTDYAELVRAEGIVAEIAVPVRSEDETHGVLYVSNRSARALTDHDEAVLRRLADLAGAAIKNANLYSGLRAALDQVARSQAALVQSERLRALGEMAGGVAHDFNNMLAVIAGRSELLLEKATDPAMQHGLTEILRAATEGAAKVRRIQNFTGKRLARSTDRVSLGEVVRDVLALTRARWKDEAQRLGLPYEVTMEGEAPEVSGDADDLREVFANLVHNALDAMPEGGRCVIRLGSDGDLAVAEVADSGRGMTPQVAARIFEPFFTTKGPRGSGLGLSVSWGIVNAGGGTITVDSTPGAGTRMTVRLPRASAGSEARTRRASATRRARVLVIDDDPGVRDVLVEMLAALGHTVQPVESGADGVALCAQEPFDLVITDLSMPAMSGWDVAEAVVAARPGLPVGVVTGWGEQVDPEQAARHRLSFVLAKPFVMKDVRAAVARALGG
jgi:signal transduction histidine kinase/DNA-binding response OmpR family regulator